MRLTLGERQVELTALVDTGNTLTDPVTGRPVMVAEGDTPGAPVPTGDSGPGRRTCGTRRGRWSGWGRAPGGGACACCPTGRWGWTGACCWRCGWTGARVGGEERGPMLVALSPTPVSDGGGYGALIWALT